MAGPKLFDVGDGALWIWEEPEAGRTYDIGADPALGVEGGDNSAIQVLDRATGRQVAEYLANVEFTQFKDILYWLGRHYNTAQIAVEINAGGGGVWINKELSQDYPNVYIDRRRDTVAPTFTTKTGWLTSKWSKEYAVNAAKTRVYRYCTSDEKERFPLIRSQRLFDEMRNFVIVGGMEQYGAAPGGSRPWS